MKRQLPILVAALFAACASADPPPPPAATATAVRAEPPPVYALFGYRDQLELTSEQIAALDSIGRGIQEQSDSLFTQLREDDSDERTNNLALIGQISERNLRAAERVGEVLTEEQRSRVCDLFAETREERIEERVRRTPGERGAGEGAEVVAAVRTWPWCVAPS